MSDAGVVSSTKLKADFEIDIEEFKFQWYVNENFTSMVSGGGERVITTSPIFSGGHKLRHSWELEFQFNPIGSHKLYLALVSLVGKRPSGERKILEIEAYADIYCTTGGALPTNAVKPESFLKMTAGSKLETPIDLVALVENAKRSHFSLTNGLVFHCSIFINMGSKMSNVIQGKTPPIVDSSTAVGESLGTFLNSAEFADFKFIITSTHAVIPAHEVILAAHGPIFAAMFRSNMQEAEKNSVEINDFDETVVKAMLLQKIF